MSRQNGNSDAVSYYSQVLDILLESKVPFLVGGTLAMMEYTPIKREIKDVDIFCKEGDYTKFLEILDKKGHKIELTDPRWMAKVINGKYEVDFIFCTTQGICPVDDSWFEYSPTAKIFSRQVRLVTPNDMIWSKAYLQDRTRYDGHDVYHLILAKGKEIDWHYLLRRMEGHWEILLAHLINFRFIYPSERETVPKWLIDELVSRLNRQLEMPTPKEKVCRGPLLSRTQYEVDITDGEFQFST